LYAAMTMDSLGSSSAEGCRRRAVIYAKDSIGTPLSE
jgi:hypothetical protein